MAEVNASLFFKNSVGSLNFDLILDENHNFSNDVTAFNVEDGSVISDNIRNQLRTAGLTGFISNFSLFQNGLFSNKAQDAFDTLKEIWQRRELVTIVTVLEVYKDVAITGISISRDDGTGESLTASIGFQQINIVKLQEIQLVATVKLKDMNSAQNKQSSKKLQVGKQRPVVG